MDEEYDVIVLGTGLTVSSQSGLLCACTGTKKKQNRAGCVNFHVVIMGSESTQARYPPCVRGWK